MGVSSVFRRVALFSVLLMLGLSCDGVTSPEPPAPGAILVTIFASGIDIAHPDSGYRAVLDGGPTYRLDAMRRVVMTGIAPGEHAVRLEGMAPNCSVVGGNPMSIMVASNATAIAQFTIDCVAHVGTVRVITATTGGDPDPDGYWVMVDGVQRAPVGINDAVAISDVRTGLHAISLTDVLATCRVTNPHPVNVNVPFQGTIDVHFSLHCAVPGALAVTTTTTGDGVIPGEYTVAIAAPSVNFAQTYPIAPNGNVTLSRISPADYHVTLQGVPANCDIAGPTTQTVAVLAGATSQVAFDVSCDLPTPLAIVRDGDIYVISSDGTGATPLTTEAGTDDDPAWSIRGQIAFTASRHSNDLELYVMNADGTSQVRLTTSAGADNTPSWSPDGLRIVFHSFRTVNSELYVVNADGTGLTRLTNNEFVDIQPAWSSTGKIAFVSDRDHAAGEIYVMNEDGSDVVRLTNNDVPEGSPAWSPDGSMIAFTRQVECLYGCPHDIFVMNADGSNQRRLATGWATYQYHGDPAWAPNGHSVAFTRQYCDYYYCQSSEVWVVEVDGTHLSQVTANAANPAWKP